MMSYLHSWFLYGTSLILFLNSSSFVVLWLSMEINLVSFLFLFSLLSKDLCNYNMMLYYFIIQSLGSLTFLFSSYFKFGAHWYNDFLFTLSLSLKLGIFPFYFWVMNLGGSLKPLIFFLILTFQKIFMLILFFKSYSFLMELILFMSLVFGSVSIFFCSSFSSVLVMSSVSTSFWVYTFYSSSFLSFMSFFLVYFFLLFSCNTSFFNLEFKSTFETLLLFMFLSGLPPLFMFFLKFSSFLFMSRWYELEFCLLLSLFSFLGVFGYLNYFQKTFFLVNSLYLNTKNWFMKMPKLSSATLFFFFFVV